MKYSYIKLQVGSHCFCQLYMERIPEIDTAEIPCTLKDSGVANSSGSSLKNYYVRIEAVFVDS